MDVVIDHFQQWYLAYAGAAVLCVPLIYFTRRYSLPFIQFCIEIALYSFIMHVLVWCVVGLATWFKNNSTMTALDENKRTKDVAFWETPLLEFWNREAYNPTWVFWLECVFALVIVYLVFRFRPMKVHSPHNRRYDDAGKLITKKGPRARGKYVYAKPGAARGKR